MCKSTADASIMVACRSASVARVREGMGVDRVGREEGERRVRGGGERRGREGR